MELRYGIGPARLRERFGPARLDGEELLIEMHDHANHSSLVYSTVERNHIFTVADSAVSFSATPNDSNCMIVENEIHDLGSGGTTNPAIYVVAAAGVTSMIAGHR